MRKKLAINYIKYFSFYHIGTTYLIVIILNILSLNVAECIGYIDLETINDIDHKMQQTFENQGYEFPSVNMERKGFYITEEKYNKRVLNALKIMNESSEKDKSLDNLFNQPNIPKQLISQKILEEAQEQLAQQPQEFSLQERLAERKREVEEQINNLITPYYDIDAYNKLPIYIKSYITQLAMIKEKLINIKDPLEHYNMSPTENLYNELKEMINRNPDLLTAIKINYFGQEEMSHIIKIIMNHAKKGDIIAQHFLAMVFCEGSSYINPNESIVPLYAYILKDLKTNNI